jgi:hypothetical protein
MNALALDFTPETLRPFQQPFIELMKLSYDLAVPEAQRLAQRGTAAPAAGAAAARKAGFSPAANAASFGVKAAPAAESGIFGGLRAAATKALGKFGSDEKGAFFDGFEAELRKIAAAEGHASVEALLTKEAGPMDLFRRAAGAAKGLVSGGMSAEGIPMHGLSVMNPFRGLGSSLAGQAGQAGAAVAGGAQKAVGAVGDAARAVGGRISGALRGGMSPEGIPMHGVGEQLAQMNPFRGLGSSLAGQAGQAGQAVSGAVGRAGQAVGQFARGGMSPEGVPMHSLGAQVGQMNPLKGMAGSAAEGARALGSQAGGAARSFLDRFRARGAPPVGVGATA